MLEFYQVSLIIEEVGMFKTNFLSDVKSFNKKQIRKRAAEWADRTLAEY